MRMRVAVMLLGLAVCGPAAAQGLSIPGLGGGGGGSGGGGVGGALGGAIPGLGPRETPEQKREFCRRVSNAAMSCGLTLDVNALSACLIRTLPPEDSMRVAQVANRARGNASALLNECGIGLGR